MSEEQFADFVIEQDVSDVKPWDGEYSLVAPGDYVVDVTGLKQDTSKAGNTMIVAEFTIAEAEAQASDEAGQFSGQKLWCYYTLTKGALGRLAQLQIACGASLQRFVASEVFGSRIRVHVTNENGGEYTDKDGNVKQGKDQARVGGERPLNPPEAQPQTKAATPPIARGGANGATKPAASKPAATGAARRA